MKMWSEIIRRYGGGGGAAPALVQSRVIGWRYVEVVEDAGFVRVLLARE